MSIVNGMRIKDALMQAESRQDNERTNESHPTIVNLDMSLRKANKLSTFMLYHRNFHNC